MASPARPERLLTIAEWVEMRRRQDMPSSAAPTWSQSLPPPERTRAASSEVSETATLSIDDLPIEVKAMVARECALQDDVIREQRYTVPRRLPHRQIDDQIQLITAYLKWDESLPSLYATSRAWRAAIMPVRFSTLTFKQACKPFFSSYIADLYGKLFDRIDLYRPLHDGDADRVQLDRVLSKLPNIRQIRGCCDDVTAQALQAAGVFDRVEVVEDLVVRSLPRAIDLLSPAARVKHLSLSIFFPRKYDPQDVWRILECVPSLERLDLRFHSSESGTQRILFDYLPCRAYRRPPIKHLRLQASTDVDPETPGTPGILSGLENFLSIFAPNLVSLEFCETGSDDSQKADATLPDGTRLPLLRKLSLSDALPCLEGFWSRWRTPEAATNLRRITLCGSIYEHSWDSVEPEDFLEESPINRCPRLEDVEFYGAPQALIPRAAREITGKWPYRVVLHPRLYPTTTMINHDAYTRNLLLHDRLPEPSALSPFAHDDEDCYLMKTDEYHGVIDSIDNTIASLLAWRERAVLHGDCKSLMDLAGALYAADLERVKHLA